MSIVYKYGGELLDQSGADAYDGFASGSRFDRQLGTTATYLVDRRLANSSTFVGSTLVGHSVEGYALNSSGVVESGRQVVVFVASGASNYVPKSAFQSNVTTSQVSDLANLNVSMAIALLGLSSTATGNTQGLLVGTSSAAQVVAGSDATAYGLLASVNNAGGTAVTTLNTPLSKIGIVIGSTGNAKNTAFMYCVKSGNVTTPGVNSTYGVLVDGASVDTLALGVVSGNTPTTLWARDPAGKRLVSVTSGSGAGPIAGGAASHITVTTVSQTAAAGATGTPVVVNTTAVTASSRIIAQIISYSGTLTTNGLPIVYITAISAATSFTFVISNAHSANALSGTVTVAFTIEN